MDIGAVESAETEQDRYINHLEREEDHWKWMYQELAKSNSALEIEVGIVMEERDMALGSWEKERERAIRLEQEVKDQRELIDSLRKSVENSRLFLNAVWDLSEGYKAVAEVAIARMRTD